MLFVNIAFQKQISLVYMKVNCLPTQILEMCKHIVEKKSEVFGRAVKTGWSWNIQRNLPTAMQNKSREPAVSWLWFASC